MSIIVPLLLETIKEIFQNFLKSFKSIPLILKHIIKIILKCEAEINNKEDPEVSMRSILCYFVLSKGINQLLNKPFENTFYNDLWKSSNDVVNLVIVETFNAILFSKQFEGSHILSKTNSLICECQ